MTTVKINPESDVLAQLDEHWQKVAMMLLWKLAGCDKVSITTADIEQLDAWFSPGMAVIYTHGHSDSIDFQLVDEARAQALADYDATLKGTS